MAGPDVADGEGQVDGEGEAHRDEGQQLEPGEAVHLVTSPPTSLSRLLTPLTTWGSGFGAPVPPPVVVGERVDPPVPAPLPVAAPLPAAPPPPAALRPLTRRWRAPDVADADPLLDPPVPVPVPAADGRLVEGARADLAEGAAAAQDQLDGTEDGARAVGDVADLGEHLDELADADDRRVDLGEAGHERVEDLAALEDQLVLGRPVGVEQVGGVVGHLGEVPQNAGDLVAPGVDLGEDDVERLGQRHHVGRVVGQRVAEQRQVGEQLLGVHVVGRHHVGQLLEVAQLLVDGGPLPLRRLGQGVEHRGQLVGIDLGQHRVGGGQDVLQLGAPGVVGLGEVLAAPEERPRQLDLGVDRDDVDELLPEQRLGLDGRGRVGGDLLVGVDLHLDQGPAVDQTHALDRPDGDPVDLDVGLGLQPLAGGVEAGVYWPQRL